MSGLGDPDTALVAISVVSGWVFAGFYMAIFYAAFQQIPDGARGRPARRRRRRADLLACQVPMVRHAVEVALLLCITGGLQSFDLFYVLTNGGPYNSTESRRRTSSRSSSATRRWARVGLGGDPHRGRARDRRALQQAALAPSTARLMTRLIGGRALFRTVLAVLALFYGFPMVWMVLSSFKTNRETVSSPLALPSSIDFRVWADAWRIGNLGRFAINSTIVTASTVVLILLFAALAAYAFSGREFGGSGLLFGLLLLGLLMPLQSYFIAQNSMFEELGLKDLRLALILPYTAMGLLAVYLLKVFLDSLPASCSTRQLDGCGDVRMFTALVLPLLKPGGWRRWRSSRRSTPGTSSSSPCSTSATIH